MAVTLIYTWDMKKMVAQQIADIKNLQMLWYKDNHYKRSIDYKEIRPLI